MFLTDPRADFNAHIDAPAEVDTIVDLTHEFHQTEPKGLV